MKKKRHQHNREKKLDLANHELVVIAAYMSGAQFKYVDTEHIAVKTNEIAPGRFNWRHYKDQINIEIIRRRLWDAASSEKGCYLIGSQKKGWMLTESGREFAEANASKLESLDLSKSHLSANEKAWLGRERIRMMGEIAFRKFVEGDAAEISPSEAERFFRIDDYILGEARGAKIERAKNVFSKDPDLSAAIQAIAQLVREK